MPSGCRTQLIIRRALCILADPAARQEAQLIGRELKAENLVEQRLVQFARGRHLPQVRIETLNLALKLEICRGLSVREAFGDPRHAVTENEARERKQHHDRREPVRAIERAIHFHPGSGCHRVEPRSLAGRQFVAIESRMLAAQGRTRETWATRPCLRARVGTQRRWSLKAARRAVASAPRVPLSGWTC
jgi:hypothetical protein